jgi:hypothetical protein
LAAVQTGNAYDGKWGFIDKKGKQVIPFQYNSILMVFNNGAAQVMFDEKTWGWIDKKGKVLWKSK